MGRGQSLDLDDFLSATSDSVKRSRTIMIVLVVACVLAMVGFLNSIDSSWMFERLQKVSDPHQHYVTDNLGQPISDTNDERYKNFDAAITRAFVDNALTVRVPFFGVAFDINDLGLLGGLGFVVILTLLRFSIRAEMLSLRLGFKAAARASKNDPKQFETFYDLLAMRQVLTLPHMEDESINWVAHRSVVLAIIPKLICFLPFVVYSLVATNDFMTRATGESAGSYLHVWILLFFTAFFWVVILTLSIWCFMKLKVIDEIWEEYWKKIKAPAV